MASLPPLIVVVDDEPAIAEIICAILEDEGLRAMPAAVGLDAFPLILRELPAIAILDVQMPLVDGIEIFQQMRANHLTAAIPVIFLTANERIVPLRVPDYHVSKATVLPKPFDVLSLLALVHSLLP
jgi:DNA-binding response OmpR family regulator